MKLHINAFRITLETDKGQFGTTATFNKGLNVIRAENTSGKSALINGILYALGLEVLIGKRGVEATKPVMRSEGDYDGEKFKVVESFVELEIVNSMGNAITIRRYIVGDKDSRLVEVITGSVLTEEQDSVRRVSPYYVGMQGAAQRDQGFHYFLANFLELELPYVKRFKGDDVPLYVECIAPLMFIEQIRGWSGIQATLPQSFGIRNVAKLAVEYILKLDVIENEKKRIEMSEEASRIRDDWLCIRELLSQISSQAVGRLMNVGDRPVASLPDEPWISCSSEEGAMSLDNLIIAKRKKWLEQSKCEIPDMTGKEELGAKLDQQQNELLVAQSEVSQLRSDILSEKNELIKLKDRLDFIKADTQRNKDAKRLRNFGVEVELSIVQDKCPTCSQNIQDSLIPTGSSVMGIDENISFLKAEEEAVTLLISAVEERIDNLNSQKSSKTQILSKLRATIRDLRSDLLESRGLSVATIREQIHLQEEVLRLEQLRDEFDKQIERLKEVAKSCKENRADRLNLPDDFFSEDDRTKLRVLSEYFAKNVKTFGYRSTGVSQLHISDDNYRPVCDEFEVAFGASASDNIRLIWSYTISLLQVSLKHNGTHWGTIIFDEPEQQKMREASSDALYAEIAQMHTDDFQVIIATSASRDVTRSRLKGINHNLLEYGDKVIRPIITEDM